MMKGRVRGVAIWALVSATAAASCGTDKGGPGPGATAALDASAPTRTPEVKSGGQGQPALARPELRSRTTPGTPSTIVPYAACAGTNLGTGADGAWTAPAGTSTFSTPTTSVSNWDGAVTLTVGSSAGFSANNLVLIVQAQQGAFCSAGAWEINKVVSTTATTLTLAYYPTYGCVSGPQTGVLAARVPQYTNVTIGSGSTVVAPAWNGSSGGIVAFVANGTVSIGGTLDASGMGYRGGARGPVNNNMPPGWAGEGPYGLGMQIQYGNTGGGGGGASRSGGGGAGFGIAGASDGDGTSTGGQPYDDPGLTSLFLGSGGGGAGNYYGTGGNGGAGGGWVFVAGSSVAISSGGIVRANGAGGGNSSADGGGGGGSGGAILLEAQTLAVSGVLSASGGGGGSGGAGVWNGGSGGAGRIAVTCGTVNGASCSGSSGSFSNPAANVASFCSTVPGGAGGACPSSSECTSGLCNDGYCCLTASCSGACSACAAGTGACVQVTNAADTNCSAANHYCNASSACVAQTGPGGSCTVPVGCTSNVCLNGVCCAGACNGTTSICDATGACKLKTGQPSTTPSTCASGFASDGYCCNTACAGACDVCAASLGASANGTCTPAPVGYPGNPVCVDFACDGTDVTCAAACTSDVDCQPGDYCAANGTCQPQKVLGAACNEATGGDCVSPPCRECTTGHCVDKVCCATACNGLCEACAAAVQQSTLEGGAPTDGICGNAKAHTNPHGDTCASSTSDGGVMSCGPDGTCDGNGACSLFAAGGAPCGPTSCDMSNNSLVGQLCNGNGACQAGGSVMCGLFLCANGVCPATCATDSDCLSTAHCVNTACVIKQPNGKSCTKVDECSSGLCVDGVCCNSPCTGQCEACNVTATAGTCTPVVGKPTGTRPVCPTGTAGDPCAAAECNGIDALTCAGFTGPSTTCGTTTCANGMGTLVGACDGTGHCKIPPTTVPCSPYACGATACLTACTADADCVAGNKCDVTTGKCVTGATCDADGHTTTGANGKMTDCSPYTCQSNGTCLQSCTAVTDCVSPNVCNASGQCVAPPSGGGGTGSSGGCAVGQTETGGGTGWVIAVAFAAMTRVRRRRPLGR